MTTFVVPPTTSSPRCLRCGSYFSCGITNGSDSCWCFTLPRVMPVDENATATGCLCPDCLRAALKQHDPQRQLDTGRKPDA